MQVDMHKTLLKGIVHPKMQL